MYVLVDVVLNGWQLSCDGDMIRSRCHDSRWLHERTGRRGKAHGEGGGGGGQTCVKKPVRGFSLKWKTFPIWPTTLWTQCFRHEDNTGFV